MGPRCDDDIAEGPPAKERMEVVLSGDRRVITDRSIALSVARRVNMPPNRVISLDFHRFRGIKRQRQSTAGD